MAETVGYHGLDGSPYPVLPETPTRPEDRAYVYGDPVPVFFGHYWRRGVPVPGRDYTDYTACTDFSAVLGGALNAYRWSGESVIDPDNYVRVGAGNR